MIRKRVYNLRKSISFFFLKLALIINNHKLCAFIIWLNIRKFKTINFSNSAIKKVLVFSKSGGNEDLIQSFHGDKNNNIIFYWIPRSFLKTIYKYFLGSNSKDDYFTKFTKPNEIIKKNQYISFLILIFDYLDKFTKFDGFISFNIFYYSEKDLDAVFKNLNKKFIILHKESTFTPLEELEALKIYKKNNDKTLADKISVYSKSQKKILLQSKIAKNEQITVNGCARSDYSFKLRNLKPKNNIIIFYLIENQRSKNLVSNKQKVNWKKLNDSTLKYLINFAKDNPNTKIILKGKTGVHTQKDYSSKILPKNCIFIEGGTGDKFLKDAKIVIAFNSTIIFEAIASNRNLIIPNFNNENIKYRENTYRSDNRQYLVNSKNEFEKRINFYLGLKYKNRKLQKFEEKILDYYLGSVDGKSGKRLRKFIKLNIK